MQSGVLRDIIIRDCALSLQLFPCKNQTLLIRRDPLPVLDLGLYAFDVVAGLNVEGDCFSRHSI